MSVQSSIRIQANESFVKELLIKMEVLKNGILDERRKNSVLEKKYENLQVFTNEKENEIIELSKEKQELLLQLSIEKKKYESKGSKFKLTDFFNKTVSPDEEDQKEEDRTNQLAQLKFENEVLNNRLIEALQQYEQYKEDYKKLIQVQIIKIQVLEETIEQKNKEIEVLKAKIGTEEDFDYQMEKERSHYGNMIITLTKEKDEYYAKFRELYGKLQKITLEKETFKEAIHKHEVESGKLAQKLAEYKNALIESNLKIQVYHCEKIGIVNKDIDITFGETNENRFVMKITDDKHRSDLINIEDVEYMKVIEANLIEIKYMVILYYINYSSIQKFIQLKLMLILMLLINLYKLIVIIIQKVLK